MSEAILDSYTDTLEADGYAESTIDLYASMVRQALKAKAFNTVKSFNSFINARRESLSDNGLNSQLAALSNFRKNVQFLDYSLSETIANRIDRVVKSARISSPTIVQDRRAYTVDEVEAIYQLETSDWRWHYLHIGLNFGLRSNEIRSLQFSDFDLDNRYLNVRSETTKTKKFRYIPITDSVFPIISTRSKLKASKQKYYVEARRGHKVSARSSQHWVNEEEQLGFSILSHNLRYTFATWLWEATGNIILIQKYLGHASPEITWRYLKLKREDLDNQFLQLDFKVM